MALGAAIKWGVVLGFALGGFFDGILLHQILQWHHLLSLVPGVDSLRAQVLWDGYFHALMYVVATVGFWGLWRVRLRGQGFCGRTLLAALLVGFGLWHVVDSVLSHWLLGIHRIKLDSAYPLMWDLIWFAGFGVLPLLLGWSLLRRPAVINDGGEATTATLLTGLLAVGLGAWSLQPAEDQRFTTIVFGTRVGPADAMNAVVDNGGRLMWSDRDLTVVVVAVSHENRLNFYGRGALLVSGAGMPTGCFNWSRT